MKRRTVLGTMALLPVAGCAGVSRSEATLDADLVSEGVRKRLEFFDGDALVADVEVSPVANDPENLYFFSVRATVTDELRWSSLAVTFSFPSHQPVAGTPIVYLRASSIAGETIERVHRETKFEVREPADQYLSYDWAVHDRRLKADGLEMEADIAVSVLEEGLFETAYVGRDAFSIDLL